MSALQRGGMDLTHFIIRRLEESDWSASGGMCPFGFTCGTTSPKHDGRHSYGPFHAALREGSCTHVECMLHGTRTYVFAMRIGSEVHICRCVADDADRYTLELSALHDSWTTRVGRVLVFDSLGGAAAWVRDSLGGVTQWRDKGEHHHSFETETPVSPIAPAPRGSRV